MCGIIGEISVDKIDINLFTKMRDVLIHRGPDGEGSYFNNNYKVALGHRRLSILDLSSRGQQPMCNENKSIWITYNGEIYNFQDLKDELISKNHKFKSGTDTEVIIHGYEEWGINVLKKLRGMFAFGIWDENKKRLLLARDRIGIKPLYYYYKDKRFIFASELKAIVIDDKIERKINSEALKDFFFKGYVPAPLVIWKNFHKLPPGHLLIYENNNITIKEYWSFNLDDIYYNEREIIKNIEKILTESIDIRFISDVPVGVLLSGGLDSSIVCALASKKRDEFLSFSIGFKPKKFSELKYAKKVVNHLNINNFSSILTPHNIYSYLDKIIYAYDEPFGISSVFPTMMLMEKVSKKLKVVLSGDGGDELFAGYNWYEINEKYRKFSFLKPIATLLYNLIVRTERFISNKILTFLRRHLRRLSLNNFERYSSIHDTYFSLEEIKKLLSQEISKEIDYQNFLERFFDYRLNNIKDTQFLDIKTFLVDHILVKVDRASMAYSVETRVPYLDHKLLEYVMNVNHKIIYKNNKKKYLLKKIGKKYLPNSIIHRKKKGFSAPLNEMGFIKNYLRILDNPLSVKDKIINGEYIKNLLRNYKKNPSKDPFKIWILIMFELWYNKWKKK